MERAKKVIPEFNPKLVWNMAREALLFVIFFHVS
jgi:hypothetical protein